MGELPTDNDDVPGRRRVHGWPERRLHALRHRTGVCSSSTRLWPARRRYHRVQYCDLPVDRAVRGPTRRLFDDGDGFNLRQTRLGSRRGRLFGAELKCRRFVPAVGFNEESYATVPAFAAAGQPLCPSARLPFCPSSSSASKAALSASQATCTLHLLPGGKIGTLAPGVRREARVAYSLLGCVIAAVLLLPALDNPPARVSPPETR